MLAISMETVLQQVEGMRGDLAALKNASLKSAVPSFRPAATASESTTDPAAGTEPRPSLAVQAAQKTTHVGKIVMIVMGVLSVVGQVIAIWKPQYAGPIIEALRLFASLGG